MTTKNTSQINTICFDLDGVYFTNAGKQAFDQWLIAQGLPADQLQDFHWSDQMRRLVRGQAQDVEIYDLVRQMTSNAQLSNKEIQDAWVAGYVIDTQVQSDIRHLKKQGYQTAVCTNNNSIRCEALFEKFPEMREDFDVVITSYEIGHVKPEKQIFQALIDACGCAAEQIVYTDDNPERISGARELGIQALASKSYAHMQGYLKRLGIELV